MSKDARAFFFHFNKPASRSAKKPKISVHTKGKCHIVDNVECEVPVKGRINKRRQPHFVMAGRGVIKICGNEAGDQFVAFIMPSVPAWDSINVV